MRRLGSATLTAFFLLSGPSAKAVAAGPAIWLSGDDPVVQAQKHRQMRRAQVEK
jgi:hypothetical protein